MKSIFAIFLVMSGSALAQYHGKGLIAHRGASAYAPENTLPAFELAVQQGTDYLEHDLQMTKDGVLVVLHDTTLERTTDVAKVFPNRSRDGHWYVYDFTMEEIKKLDAGSWFGEKFRGTRVPSWQDLIDFARGKAGLYVETKGPELYDKLGLNMEKAVMEALRRNGLERPGAVPKTPVLIQSFSDASIRRMKDMGCKLPLQILFVDCGKSKWCTAEGLAEASKYATGMAPEKNAVRKDPELVTRVHKAGMTIALWTFSAGNTGEFADVREEMAFYLNKLGVDAAITNNPDKFPR